MQSCLTQQSLIDIILHLTRLLLQIGKEPVVNFREFLSVLSNGSSTRNFMFTGRSHVRRIELVVRYLLSGSNERAHVRKLVDVACDRIGAAYFLFKRIADRHSQQRTNAHEANSQIAHVHIGDGVNQGIVGVLKIDD